MENKISKKEQANPIFNTAKYTLYNLSKSGVKEAEKYLEALGFDEAQIAAYGASENIKDEIMLPSLIVQEARYCFINRMIEEKGYKNILDLACGFSPRGYKYSKAGYIYVGADLPATVELVEPVARKAMDTDCKIPVKYCALDLTNPASVADAAKQFDGEVCIVVEGLLMYLDPSETAQFIEGVKAVLEEHGGCFVTPDYCSGAFYRAVFFPMYGQEEGMQLLLASAKALEETSDATLRVSEKKKSLLSGKGDDIARDFFEARGLKIENVPFYDYGTRLMAIEKTDPEVAETIKAELNKTMAWVITLDEKPEKANGVADAGRNRESRMFVEGDVLRVELAGRVDSINAPVFIEQYETLAKDHKIETVTVNMKNLEYISSAGLRFLLMMKKSVSGKYVGIKNANPEVMEIFNITGFAEILDME